MTLATLVSDCSKGVNDMMWADVRRNWQPLGEQMREQWKKLTLDDITEIAGRRHQLIALLQLRYGIDQKGAAAQADEFVRALQVLSR